MQKIPLPAHKHHHAPGPDGKDAAGQLPHRAKENDCILAMFGHTHRLFWEQMDGIMVFNPGSISLPRGGKKSYGRLTIEPDGFTIEPIIL